MAHQPTARMKSLNLIRIFVGVGRSILFCRRMSCMTATRGGSTAIVSKAATVIDSRITNAG